VANTRHKTGSGATLADLAPETTIFGLVEAFIYASHIAMAPKTDKIVLYYAATAAVIISCVKFTLL
jgi:hypothetical protein